MERFKGLEVAGKKNTVVLGEGGSGKTEFAITLALYLRESAPGGVTALDMDQTKPLFRLRAAAPFLEAQGVRVVHGEEFLDSPLVPHGVAELLGDPDQRVVMDVGGGQSGALCLGQYRELLQGGDTQVFYLVNPYRAMSGSPGALMRTMGETLPWAGAGQARIICNPYCGGTGAAEAAAGARRLSRLLEPLGLRWEAVMLPEALWEALSPRWEKAVCIRPRMSRVLDLEPPGAGGERKGERCLGQNRH